MADFTRWFTRRRKMQCPMRVLSVAVGLTVAIASVAQAGPILMATGATTDMGSASATYSPAHAIDQSGLAAGYTSGVTDFDTFVASTSTSFGANSGMAWFSVEGVLAGNFDFDLGGTYTLSSFALWNDPQDVGNQGVRNFSLYADDNSAFSSPTLLGSYTAAEGTGTSGNLEDLNLGQIFTFFSTEAAFIRMAIESNYGSTDFTGFTEAAFEIAGPVPVPEPGSLLLLGTGIAGIVATARKRRKQQIQ
jgi:hypothetical protein